MNEEFIVGCLFVCLFILFFFFLKKILESRGRVSVAQHFRFWDWWGAVLTGIRFKRNMRSLWVEG